MSNNKGRMDGRTDGQTDGRMFTHQQFRGAKGQELEV